VNQPTSPHAKRHLGQILIDQGILTEDQLRIALLEQTKQHIPVGKLLVKLGFVSEATLRDALSEKLGLQAVDLTRIIVDPAALKMVPRELARRYRVFPVALDRQQRKFIVAIADTNNIVALDQVRTHLKDDFEIELRLAGDSEIESAIEHYYGHEFSIDGILKEIETGEVDYSTVTEGDEYSQPVVRLISALLADAVERAASDIHFEPEQNFLRIRYRIDGVLRQIRSLHKTYWPAMAVRIKVMAKMNIAETRAPQDGRISATMSGRVIDFRVASLPTAHGENLVLRILDRQKGIVPLDKLGLEESQLEVLKRMIARPEGIILVTGPTGSGKTTTLYAALRRVATAERNVLTIEDPVEYELPGVGQMQVNPRIGLDFGTGLRAILRQDPDVILVGEIRDRETVRIALQAALTGHLVFATMHTNDAPSAVTRLLEMEVEPHLIASTVRGVIAQRLVSRRCGPCAGAGCARCGDVGLRGRTVVHEILEPSAALRALVLARADAARIRDLAISEGMRTMRERGEALVRDGTTSQAELDRVLGEGA